MKNISRRVFIKGMAVAAAATAASTVLAGCNLVPGTDEPIVEPTPSASVLSFTDPDDSTKTFSLKMTGSAVQKKPYNGVAVAVSVDNNMAQTVKSSAGSDSQMLLMVDTDTFATNNYVAKDEYFVKVSAYYDGETDDKATIAQGNSASTDSVVFGSGQAQKPCKDDQVTAGYVYITGVPEGKKKVTVKFELMQMLTDQTTATASVFATTGKKVEYTIDL